MPNVLSFNDVSTVMVQDWLAAGYDCWCVDMQHPRGVTDKGRLHLVGADLFELYRGHWWLPDDAAIAFGAPECTYLTISANRWQRARGPGCVARGLLQADAVWRLLVSYDCGWMMENPAVGRLSTTWRKPDFTFHPWEYAAWLENAEAENTTKNTGLWTGGGFVLPDKRPAAEPHRHDCHDEPPGENRADTRSRTPSGFAKAVFAANHQIANGRKTRSQLEAIVKQQEQELTILRGSAYAAAGG